ncbi:hypothetical protein B0H11DRAFT_2030570 [Mycena galericulata]|nr:hypothetical protein B0H11DRAFT_2030570 [Mycena galericulata]
MVFPFLPRLSLVRVSFVTALLVCLVFFLDPFKSPPVYGPVTLEEHFAALVPEAFAHYREFERLQELYHPAILTMTRKWNSDPDGPILLDIEVRYPDEPVYENDDDIDIDIVNVNDDDNDKDDDASRTHRAVPVTEEPTTTPRPGAFPRSRRPPSTSPLLAFICLAVSMMAAGTLVVCARLRCKVACCAARQVAPRPALATRPRVKSSGETRRCWLFPLQRSRKFRSSLPSIDEHPCSCMPQVPSTSDGAAFMEADQQDVKSQEIAAPSETNVSVSPDDKVSKHSRAYTDINTSKSTTVLPRSRIRTAPGQLPGQLRLVPTSPTWVGVPVHQIVAASSPTVPFSSARTLPSVPNPVPSPTQPIIGEILYETPTTPRARTPQPQVIFATPMVKTNSVLYETPRAPPAPSPVLYSTSGSTAAPSIHTLPKPHSWPTSSSSGIVFHGRSGPPIRPFDHQHSVSAFSTNMLPGNPFGYAQLQPTTYHQFQPVIYHHAHPYLLGVAQARAPRAW